jgi:peptidoglycan-N-acetylglucosamine deacetylase
MALRISRRELLAAGLGGVLLPLQPPQTVPERLVVLTFDDGPASHANYVAPLLVKYGFGATFFVCEFPPNFADKTLYMTWEQMASLHQMGFEVGNHTIAHRSVTGETPEQFSQDLEALEIKASTFGIPKMVSFAYPSYGYNAAAIEVLKKHGYRFARAGLDRVYNPAADSRYVIPGFTATATNRDVIMNAIRSATGGHIVVLTFHGVPDIEHPWVTTPRDLFEEYLRFLEDHDYRAIALRDLSHYLPAAGMHLYERVAELNVAQPFRAARRPLAGLKACATRGCR